MQVIGIHRLKMSIISHCFVDMKQPNSEFVDNISKKQYNNIKSMCGVEGLLSILGTLDLHILPDGTLGIATTDAIKVVSGIVEKYPQILHELPTTNTHILHFFDIDNPQLFSIEKFPQFIRFMKVFGMWKQNTIKNTDYKLYTPELQHDDFSINAMEQTITKKCNTKKKKGESRLARAVKMIEHATDAIKQNKRLLCIDIEAYERAQHKITEIGYCIREGHKEYYHHIIIKEHEKLRNGKFVADNKDHFNFGTSQTLSMGDAIEQITSELGKCEYVVGHAVSNDIKWLKQQGVSVANIKRLDTSKMAYGCVKNKHSTVGLKTILEHFSLEHTHLHNAGNDSAYTMHALAAMTTN